MTQPSRTYLRVPVADWTSAMATAADYYRENPDGTVLVKLRGLDDKDPLPEAFTGSDHLRRTHREERRFLVAAFVSGLAAKEFVDYKAALGVAPGATVTEAVDAVLPPEPK
jgi:hypothetical protein